MSLEFHDEDDNCKQCGHHYAPHIVVTANIEKGGLVFCQEDGCACSSTWSLDQRVIDNPEYMEAFKSAEWKTVGEEPL